MDRRVKERLVGAVILLALIVSIVPELLPGPAPSAKAAKPAIAPEPVRNITVDLATSKAPETGPAADASAASSAQPAEAHGTAAASAAVNAAANAAANAAGPPPAVPPAHLETAAPTPKLPASGAKPRASTGAWAVQLGSFASRANADKLMHQLHAQGFAVYLVPGGSGAGARYRVRVGPMADRGAAAQVVAKLKSLGHPASFVPPAP
jgi:DedD protein